MKIRTISEAVKQIHQDDPKSAVTMWGFRGMVLSGQIPSVKVGRKYLVDVDRISEYLSPTPPDPAPQERHFGTIRPLRVAK
jgi:hypothetical protein